MVWRCPVVLQRGTLIRARPQVPEWRQEAVSPRCGGGRVGIAKDPYRKKKRAAPHASRVRLLKASLGH